MTGPGGDVNEDGIVDLVCHFLTAETGLKDGDREAVLKGRTVTGIDVSARDEIRAKSKGKNSD
jgi:hypothetical protein